jgi:hypothetical protein
MHRQTALIIGIILVLSAALPAAAHAQASARRTAAPAVTDGSARRAPISADSSVHSRRTLVPSDSAAPVMLSTSPVDSVRISRDTLPPPRVDTARILPMGSLGSLSPALFPYPGMDANDIRWNEYRTTTDLLSGIPGVFVRDMGSPGQDNQVTINGAEHTGTAFLVDGIGQNDPFTGSYNFAFFPVEGIERLEVVTGPRSFLYGDNAVGGTINVVTKNFSNNRPFTRIRYSQGVDSYTQTDAMFAQNIYQRFNLSFGLSYLGYGSDNWAQSLNRARYVNADNEAYTFRTKLRYNMSHTVNLTFTHFYDKTQTGLNGGVDVPATLANGFNVYDENAATVVNHEAYQKLFNHHAALAATYRPDGDSSLTATLTLYGAQQRRELRDDENRGTLPTNGIVIHDDFQTNVLGARAQVDWAADGNLLSVIGEVKRTRFGNSIFGGGGVQSDQTISAKDEYVFGRYVSAALYVKNVYSPLYDLITDGGADITLKLPGAATLTLGASAANRRPAIADRMLAGGADTLAMMIYRASGLTGYQNDFYFWGNENHVVTEASLTITPGEKVRAGITATRRVIDSWVNHILILPQPTIPNDNFTVDCVTASFAVSSGNFHIDGDATYTHHSQVLRGTTAITLYPEWRGQASIYYRGLLAKGNLDLKAGVKGNFFSEFDGEQFNTLDAVLISSGSATVVNRPIGNAGTAGLFVVAHIGDAYIHVIWENLTNSAYMLTPFYPMYARSIRFGVTWDFQD